MKLNFIWTSGEFKYQYYLAIQSGMSVHDHSGVILWTTVNFEYSPLIKILKDKGLIVIQLENKDFPALKNADEKLKAVTYKDYLLWYLGYNNGGIFLDLDTISISNISNLLEDKDIVVPLDTETVYDCPHPFNSAIIIIKDHTEIALDLLNRCLEVLSQDTLLWGDTGPALLTKSIFLNQDVVNIIPFGVLGGYHGQDYTNIYADQEIISHELMVLHAFAANSGSLFENITSVWIENSNSPYATAIKKILFPGEWNIFTVESWLMRRGQHYKPMFDYLKSNKVYNILEIGTNNGDNAIGMITTSPVDNNKITYYGFDLFEKQDLEFQNKEASTGYDNPPCLLEVKQKIEVMTEAMVNLYEGNSRETIPNTNLPIMDFIYIDGGHSIETITNDWKNVQKCIDKNTIIFFDDYFVNNSEVGCKFMPSIIEDNYDVTIAGQVDNYEVFSAQLLIVKPISKTSKTINGKPIMRFHLLGLAHVPTHKDVSMCAYTQKILKLSKMLTDLGHEVFLYGGEGTDAVCTEFIQCITNEERIHCYGDYDWRKDFFKHSGTDFAYTTFNNRATEEINKRKKPKDILLVTMGNYQQPISINTGVVTVESGIGYTGTFAKFKVYESYSWMHYMYGLAQLGDGDSYDCVIPNYFYPEDFPYQEQKSDYFLYIGRLIKRKGIEIAVEVTKRLGVGLIVAGQGSLIDQNEGLYINSPHVKHIGSVGPIDRAELMGKAKAVFVPTMYIEPFGGVAVESQMCGTPVITSDWGAFTETVQHGKTGFRCRTLDDYIWAANNINSINPIDCNTFAVANYSAERVVYMYDEYFHKILDLWDNGWYTQHPKKKELDWLNKRFIS